MPGALVKRQTRIKRQTLLVTPREDERTRAGDGGGSVAAYLLTHSAVPLLVLQDLPERELQEARGRAGSLTPPPLRASYASEIV